MTLSHAQTAADAPTDRPEGWEWEYAFRRRETRHTLLKRGPLDCGHTIDGGEPYRYLVFKLNGFPELWQFRDCEFCARADNRY